MSSSGPEEIEIPIAWVGLDEAEVIAANQMAIQHSASNEFVLSFGFMSPPLIVGDTEQERREQLEMLTFIPIRTITRIAFTRQRLEELIEILQRNLQKHDNKYA